MIIYDSCQIYIESAKTLQGRIANIDRVIDALILLQVQIAANADVQDYELDDGQTKIKSQFRSPESVVKTIMALENVKQIYVNRLNGRVVRLVDGKNMTWFGNGNF